MSSLIDGSFIKRRCYLKLGAGTVMSCIRLRADCFFRHWPLKAVGIDEEGYVRAVAMASYPDRQRVTEVELCGYVRAVAMASYPDRQRVTEVELCIDPMTSDLIEYRYTEQGSSRVFALVGGEYLERAAEAQGGELMVD